MGRGGKDWEACDNAWLLAIVWTRIEHGQGQGQAAAIASSQRNSPGGIDLLVLRGDGPIEQT